MRDNPLATKYSDDESLRYEIFQRENGLFSVWLQQKCTNDVMGYLWSGYCDIPDRMHLTDTLARAIEIGEEGLRNLM